MINIILRLLRKKIKKVKRKPLRRKKNMILMIKGNVLSADLRRKRLIIVIIVKMEIIMVLIQSLIMMIMISLLDLTMLQMEQKAIKNVLFIRVEKRELLVLLNHIIIMQQMFANSVNIKR